MIYVFRNALVSFVAIGFFSPMVAEAGFVAYRVSVNTSSLADQGGNLDFQFNPGDSSAEAASITITNFHAIGGILSQPSTLTGNAAGSLPGTLKLDNGMFYNDAFQGFTYGDNFTFVLTLSGLAIDSPSGTVGSSFALSLYDEAGFTPLLTTDPNGSVLTVNLNANGTSSVETFGQTSSISTSVVMVTPLAVPEPISVFLLCIGLLTLVGYCIYRGKRERLLLVR